MGWVSRLIEWVALVWRSPVLFFGDAVWGEVFRRKLSAAALFDNGSGDPAPRDKL